jgi:hypothetical protein
VELKRRSFLKLVVFSGISFFLVPTKVIKKLYSVIIYANKTETYPGVIKIINKKAIKNKANWKG